MRLAKRVVLFVAVNVLIVASLSILLSVLGISPSLGGRELNLGTLAAFCLVWGFGGALISLALSRVMAKWMMGVRLIDPDTRHPAEKDLVNRVHSYATQAGLTVMPWVGIYDSPELNAFATGPTRNRALVAVSSGLLDSMDKSAVDGVLAHEVAHIANGDMVTMTLIQGVVNALVMFLARIVAWFAGQMVAEEKRPMVQFGIVLALELGLGVLGMMIVAHFSRGREYRADEGGARLAGTSKMIAALQGLKKAYALGGNEVPKDEQAPALASLKISGKSGGFLQLFSTHPDLDDRIARLRDLNRAL
jgi:heat shock protein HtpX